MTLGKQNAVNMR